MKQWQFDFICMALAYISAQVATPTFCKICFAISSIAFCVDLICNLIKGE